MRGKGNVWLVAAMVTDPHGRGLTLWLALGGLMFGSLERATPFATAL